MILIDRVHMGSDTSLKELHAFAAKIGLHRGWYSRGHYDVKGQKHEEAQRAGAVYVTDRELVRRMVGRGSRTRRRRTR